ncbi:ABC transporter substrate-binding protein [Dethiosulfatarculus sandiegensis]|uniref:ABC transporter substrate-binding protein n=1 Tax=Dethiosulfatarculus sandiegensis TaxID=1429043 RepID=A0A0D2J583_9BACT|nr:ABC transporter substrate-binding protein [Dethiosulfatarculus sandiegensis]KIX10866.1 ABC transporter substrate-binding protein [Dethiosulfatarculus sandiegensis]
MRKTLLLGLVLLLALTAVPAMAARSGGTIYFVAPYGGDVFSLDPHNSHRTQDSIISLNIHKCLYEWSPEKNMPVLALAESVKISPDGKVYTFKLRPNIKFHNGRQLTVDDVIWSYNRIMSLKPASNGSRFVRPILGAKEVEDGKAKTIKGLKKIDDLTLEVTLTEPVDLKYYLFWVNTCILPKEEVEKRGKSFMTNPVGCGPFKFVKWVKGSKLVVKKFDDFYLEGRPYLDKVVYNIMPESASRDLAFKAKKLDATIVGAVNYPQYLADPVYGKNLLEVAEMFTRHIGFNQSFKPFQNKKVRQAINYAIPADLIVKKLLKGKAYPARGYLPISSPAFDPKGKKYEFDLKKAKQLMKEAGYEKGFTVEQCVGTANKSWGTGIYEAAMPYLKKIGITLKIQQMEGAAMAERLRRGEYQMYIWSVGSGPDPLESLHRFHSNNAQAGGNFIAYNNPEFDKLLDKAAHTFDQKARIDLLKKADAVFVEDAPMWFFNYNKAVLASQPWVHNLSKVAVEMMYQDMTNVWVDDKSPRANEK